MSRSQFQISYHCSFEQAKRTIENILLQKNYHPITSKSRENVWKNGSGLLTAMKFLKVEYGQNQVQLSAWVQVGLGSLGGKEIALDGVTGAIPKKQLMRLVERIQSALT